MKNRITVKPVILPGFIIFFFLVFSADFLFGQVVYKNDLLRLTMNIPQNWKLVGTEKSIKNLKEPKLTDEQLKKIMESNRGVISQVGYFKYDIDSVSGFIPCIRTSVKPNPAKDFLEFKTMMAVFAEKYIKELSDGKYIEEVSEVQIATKKAVYYSYSIKVWQKSVPVLVRTKCYCIPLGSYFIAITCMDNEVSEDCSQLFAEAIGSVNFTE